MVALEFSKAVTAARAITPTWTNFFRVIIEKRALQLAYQSGSFIYTAIPQLLMKVECAPRGRRMKIQTADALQRNCANDKGCRAEASRWRRCSVQHLAPKSPQTSLQSIRVHQRSSVVEIVFVFGSRFSNRHNGDGPALLFALHSASVVRRLQTFPPRYLGGYGGGERGSFHQNWIVALTGLGILRYS